MSDRLQILVSIMSGARGRFSLDDRHPARDGGSSLIAVDDEFAAEFAAGAVQIICTGLLAAGVLRAGVYSGWVGGLLFLSTLLGLAFVALQSPIIRGAAAATLFAAFALVGVQLTAAQPTRTPSRTAAAAARPA